MTPKQLCIETTRVDGRFVRLRRFRPDTARCSFPTLPLLLLHGLGCSSDAWTPALRALARHGCARRVVAPDMPGYGHSPGPRRALGMTELADWATRLLDALEIERAHLAGNSMGCQVALALARRHPERVGGMVLTGPTTGARLVPIWRYVFGLVVDGLHEPIVYNGTLFRMYLEMGLRRYLATAKKMLADDPFAQITAVQAPCLILRGAMDGVVPERAARQLAESLPRGAFSEVTGKAHALQFNHPTAFVQNALGFLAGTEAAEEAR